MRAVKAKQWLLLRNVQIKYGQNGMNLEGYLRGDLDSARVKLNVSIFDTHDARETIDPRLKNAVRRFRDYVRQYKADIKRLEQANDNEKKRKIEDDPATERSLNSKQRRNLKRQEAGKGWRRKGPGPRQSSA